MIKRLSFLCVLIHAAAAASDIDSPRGMGERTFAFYSIPFRRAAIPISNSNELDREPSELIPNEEYEYYENDPIIYLHSLFDTGLIDQEALVREKTNITNAFQTVIATTTPAIKAFIPDSANLETDFNQCLWHAMLCKHWRF